MKYIQKVWDRLRGKKDTMVNPPSTHYGNKFIYEGQAASKLVINSLQRGSPCLIGRLGETELRTLFWFMKNMDKNEVSFTRHIYKYMHRNAGFIDANDKSLTRFCCEMLEIIRNIDILGVWFRHNEKEIATHVLQTDAKLITAAAIYPCDFNAKTPWTAYLKNKRVLVIHPFEDSIRKQYQKRSLLFSNNEILPEFELVTIKAYQSISGNNPKGYSSWFDALEDMKSEISKTTFDVALIGAGAYGLFLADHCKRIGKIGITTCGSTQALFGIVGKRFEKYDFINENWVRPSTQEIPNGHQEIEDGCYW